MAKAFYHCSVKTISRSKGRSATAAAAYRARCRIVDERSGLTFDYTKTRPHELVHAEILLPKNAPEWARDRSQLWNAVEQKETRKNSTVAREVEVSLPHQLDAKQRGELAQEMAQFLVDRYGVAVEFAIHQPGPDGDQRNHHVHILMSTRRLGPEGFTEKTRELDQKTSGEIGVIRETWEELGNEHLERAGIDLRLDHRSLVSQGIFDRQAQIHVGPRVTAMERRGVRPEFDEASRWADVDNGQTRHEFNELIKATNEAAQQFRDAAEKLAQARPDQVLAQTEAMQQALDEAQLHLDQTADAARPPDHFPGMPGVDTRHDAQRGQQPDPDQALNRLQEVANRERRGPERTTVSEPSFFGRFVDLVKEHGRAAIDQFQEALAAREARLLEEKTKRELEEARKKAELIERGKMLARMDEDDRQKVAAADKAKQRQVEDARTKAARFRQKIAEERDASDLVQAARAAEADRIEAEREGERRAFGRAAERRDKKRDQGNDRKDPPKRKLSREEAFKQRAERQRRITNMREEGGREIDRDPPRLSLGRKLLRYLFPGRFV